MFHKLNADKDTYITNKYVGTLPAVSGNVGIAGTLDLFKLYGITVLKKDGENYPQTELSRLLIHFNLDQLKDLFTQNKIDISHESFKCYLNLKDVYGGQPTPNNFSVEIFPLSASFSEGLGKDVSYYVDEDKANFLSSSNSSKWFSKGCELACFSTGSGDYITSSTTIPDTKITQHFKTGEEDLYADVTKIISATLKNDLPDSGFRISYSDSIESNYQTYFVKRFASRHAYDETKRPKLIVKFDDSIQDDSANLYLDAPASSSLFLYNYVNSQLTNLISASSEVTGSNSILLELQTKVSGVGDYSLYFTGSQYSAGSNYLTGTYSVLVSLPLSDLNLKTVYDKSGSINFTPIWTSVDKTVLYVTGSKIKAFGPERISRKLNPRKYAVSIIGNSYEYQNNEDITMRVNIFDQNSPLIFAKKLPIKSSNIVLRDSYYGIRNVVTNEYEIPFDSSDKSTKLSSDSEGMYFTFNSSALTPMNSYAVDIMTIIGGEKQKYLNASPVFKISKNG